jgi:hypothetical protein
MARNKSIIKLKGKVGSLSFYQSNGEDLVRVAGGPSADQIRSRPSMKRNRENINEFLHAASPAAKVLRSGLAGMKHLWHCNTCGNLNALLRQIIELGEGNRGQRTLSILKGKSLLKEFLFHPERRLENVFLAKYDYIFNDLRTDAVLIIPSFYANGLLNFPSGATHFRLLLGMTVLSEYHFVGNELPFFPNDPIANGKNGFTSSEYLSLSDRIPSTSIHVTLPEGIIPAPSSGTILALGIEFYQEVNGKMYLLKQSGCMKVLEVV